MTGRIIKTPEGWKQWGDIARGTVIVDDYQFAFQRERWHWESTTYDDARDTTDLDYPVEVVWVPTDRDLNTWPEDAP